MAWVLYRVNIYSDPVCIASTCIEKVRMDCCSEHCRWVAASELYSTFFSLRVGTGTTRTTTGRTQWTTVAPMYEFQCVPPIAIGRNVSRVIFLCISARFFSFPLRGFTLSFSFPILTGCFWDTRLQNSAIYTQNLWVKLNAKSKSVRLGYVQGAFHLLPFALCSTHLARTRLWKIIRANSTDFSPKQLRWRWGRFKVVHCGDSNESKLTMYELQ